MKLLILAGLAALAAPAFAQTMPATPDGPTNAPMSMPQTSTTTATTTDSTMTPPAGSMPMTPPASPAPMAMPAAPMAGEGAYPMCSHTVMDHCTERSNGRGERMHSTPRPHR